MSTQYHYMLSQADHLLSIHKNSLNDDLPATCTKGFIIEFHYQQRLRREYPQHDDIAPSSDELLQSFTELIYAKPYILISKTAMQETLCPRLSLMGVPQEDHEKLVRQTLCFLGRAQSEFGSRFVPVVAEIHSFLLVNDKCEEEHAIETAVENSVRIQSFKGAVSRLSKAMIKNLKKVKLVYDQLEVCAICLRRLEDSKADDRVSWLPCNHAYHEGCIGRWLSTQSSCPTCRFQFLVME